MGILLQAPHPKEARPCASAIRQVLLSLSMVIVESGNSFANLEGFAELATHQQDQLLLLVTR